jgi:hypothetical protein
MTMTRTNPNAPITFPGQIVAYSHNSTYTERKITPNSGPSTPLQFSKDKIRYTSPGGDPSPYTNA